MGLPPEERRKIYEEEKARIEAEEKLEKEKQEAEGVSTTNLEPRVAGLLCYIGVWVTGIIFLLIEQKNKFVRFHAIQSIIVFGILGITSAVLSQAPVVGWFFSIIIGLLTFVLWIVLMVKAYQGELYRVPLAGDLAQRMSAVSYGKDRDNVGIRRKDEHAKPLSSSEPPSPVTATDLDKQVGDKADGYFLTTRSGRITSSSFAIAWSFIFLIFLNFYNQYIAYYQLDKVDGASKWVSSPILTADFDAWLPIVTTILALSIIGHIIIIIFDWYLLRETTLIVLNLLGLIAVVSLLSIFPFDFSVIPNTTMADILPIIATIALVGIVVGLGIAILVKFVKLIVSVATRTTNH